MAVREQDLYLRSTAEKGAGAKEDNLYLRTTQEKEEASSSSSSSSSRSSSSTSSSSISSRSSSSSSSRSSTSSSSSSSRSSSSSSSSSSRSSSSSSSSSSRSSSSSSSISSSSRSSSSSSRSSSSSSSISSSSRSSSSSSSSKTPGTVVYGHHTAVDETYDEDFTENWTIDNGWTISGTPGSDAETIDATSGCGAISISDPWCLGTMTAVIRVDKYQTGSGPAPIFHYKTATTEAGLGAAVWTLYDGISFVSLGWIQLRITHV